MSASTERQQTCSLIYLEKKGKKKKKRNKGREVGELDISRKKWEEEEEKKQRAGGLVEEGRY